MSRFLIIVLILTFILLADTASASTHHCKPAGESRIIDVSYVHDGDTLWFRDKGKKSKLRIIGINTPEIKRRNKGGEPLAEYARDLLRQKIKQEVVQIVFDGQKYDRYGRILAHLFLLNGQNVTRWLLEQGAGFAIAFPHGLKYADCYRQAELKARNAKRGVWAHSYFNAVPASKVTRTGFMRVQACINRIQRNDYASYFVSAPNFALKIKHENMQAYFQSWSSRSDDEIIGLCLTVKGWVYNEKKTKRKIMGLKHPYAIENTIKNESKAS